MLRSNNTNYSNPRELYLITLKSLSGSNNTNYSNPRELTDFLLFDHWRSNNTNYSNPRERLTTSNEETEVLIIQITAIPENNIYIYI